MTEASFPLPLLATAQGSVTAPAAGSEAADEAPSEAGSEAGSEVLARMLFEIRRVPRAHSRITPEIEGRIMNRCVMAAIEVLSAAGASTELAGTPARPVVEASFGGEGAPERAARAAERVLASVRRVQRAAENEFQVVGALTVGTMARMSGGVMVTTGSSDGALHRLRERAGPGQILLSTTAFEACHDLIEATRATTGDGMAQEQAYVYVGLRPGPSTTHDASNRSAP